MEEQLQGLESRFKKADGSKQAFLTLKSEVESTYYPMSWEEAALETAFEALIRTVFFECSLEVQDKDALSLAVGDVVVVHQERDYSKSTEPFVGIVDDIFIENGGTNLRYGVYNYSSFPRNQLSLVHRATTDSLKEIGVNQPDFL